MVLLATYTGLRKANLANLCLGKQLRTIEGGYAISLEAGETKTGRPMDLILAPAVAKALTNYISIWRPILLGDKPPEERLWLGRAGAPLAWSYPHIAFRRVGLALLARPLRPHLVRHTMATGLLIDDPTATWLAGAGLGHINTRSIDEIYDRSGTAGAHRAWAELTRSLLQPHGRKGGG